MEADKNIFKALNLFAQRCKTEAVKADRAELRKKIEEMDILNMPEEVMPTMHGHYIRKNAILKIIDDN